jgi:diguanylate cyclase (GGDEF)-like protein
LSSIPTIMVGLLLVEGVFLLEVRKHESSLRQAAQTDSLTGLANRRHAYVHGTKMLASARAGGPAMALLMLDIDHFKRINDQHGHAAGDAVLSAVGMALSQRLRHGDLLSRWGGEEFLAVVPVTSPNDASALAQSLLEQLAQVQVHHEGVTLTCTASMGVAVFNPNDTTLDTLIARADGALYRAKALGRNRVEANLTPSETFVAQTAEPAWPARRESNPRPAA